jgi:hypothetical protein
MKIVIVGGGTAGWIVAATFIKYTKGHDVIVIESSKIPIIGAGEGSTGSLPWFVKTGSVAGETSWAGGLVTEMDFLRKTKATLKLGIRMQNWKGDGSHYYSPFHGTPTDSNPIDSTFLTAILKYDKSHLSSLHSWMMDDKLSTFRKQNGRIVTGRSDGIINIYKDIYKGWRDRGRSSIFWCERGRASGNEASRPRKRCGCGGTEARHA